MTPPPLGDSHDTPPPEALLDALEGRLTESERLAVLDRAARTPDGRRELELLRVALAASRDAWPDAAPARRTTWLRPGLAAAAVLTLAVGLGGGAWWRVRSAADVPDEPFRAVHESDAAGVSLATADVSTRAGHPVTLAWRPVAGATRYDVEVLAPDGAVRHAASTTDTTVVVPATAAPPAGGAAEWWVRARMADGTARRSPTGRLTAY